MEKLGTVLKTGIGLCAGAIVAELVAIGANAALDDAEGFIGRVREKLAPEPEPVKKGLFKRRRK